MDHAIQLICIAFIPMVFAITIHESMHGYVALHFGDSTAKMMGRISLNPLRHIDLVGTIIVPLGILLLSGLAGGTPLLFGWAKPVPVDFSKLRNPKRDMFWVAAAGPGSNLIMAIVWGYIVQYFPMSLGIASVFIQDMAVYGLLINISFAAINLLPLPPLDGGRMVASLLPQSLSNVYMRIEPYGIPILLVLLLVGQSIVNTILWPIFKVLQTIVMLLVA